MPARSDTYRLKDPFLDKRIKLLPCQRYMVIWWYNSGESINAIAKRFKVNKRLIQFVLFPERREKNLELRDERGGWSQYYDRVANGAAVKKHRDYKKYIISKIND
jgi:hypothetical protein